MHQQCLLDRYRHISVTPPFDFQDEFKSEIAALKKTLEEREAKMTTMASSLEQVRYSLQYSVLLKKYTQ